MNDFISVIIFTLPGLLTYFWIQMFGINPAVKHNTTEMIGLAALLWVPTSLITLTVFNSFKEPISLEDLSSLPTNLDILSWFIIISILSSLFVALLWVFVLYKWIVLPFVNKMRIKNNVSELDEISSIWDTFYLKIDEDQKKNKNGAPLVAEIYNLNNPNQRLYGSVTSMSRPFEAERALIIEDKDNWLTENHPKFPVKRTYVDTKSGLVVNELDPDAAEES